MRSPKNAYFLFLAAAYAAPFSVVLASPGFISAADDPLAAAIEAARKTQNERYCSGRLLGRIGREEELDCELADGRRDHLCDGAIPSNRIDYLGRAFRGLAWRYRTSVGKSSRFFITARASH